ncbi:MAG TPA: chromosome segregation protein SMC [Terriglobia bacterium]|nr:chromosome segregation protein SMC [Terriglobia bacterium]
MFKLKRVELLGFKSFADRTRLEFGEGTVAVVGPNGCGKSNLSDAISWVLGEQSARMLRGDRMADVIFNGTGTRPPTGMAEVSLSLIDPDAMEINCAKSPVEPGNDEVADTSGVPARENPVSDFLTPDPRPLTPVALRHRDGEITVTRRLFRSGESEYLINGDACRLRDIQDLFMGTGLGPESYAIIEQGRIGQILSSKPSDRRAIIEEAAGVSKFKTRKRLAESKLESARLNLGRVTDILEEVTKQVNSLKRQASKARRYRELKDELRGRLKLVLTSRLISLEAECLRLRGELAGIGAECSSAAAQLELLEREQKSAASRHEELEQELTCLRESLAQAELERERLRSAAEQVRRQAESLRSRTAEAETERGQLQLQLGALDEQAASCAGRAEQVHCEWEAAGRRLAQLQAAQSELSSALDATESQVEAGRQELLAAVARAAELRNQLVQTEEMGLALDRQAARASVEQSRAEQERARLGVDLEAMMAEQQREEISSASLGRVTSEVSAALDEARREQTARLGAMDALRQEFSEAKARRQALDESLARHAYSTESVRHLLSGALSTNGHSFHPLGVLADFVEVAPGYEEVVEEFLKRELDCVVVADHKEARQGIALLESEGSGRSTFFVKEFPSNGHGSGNGHGAEAAPPPRPAGVVASLQELVRFHARLGLNGGGVFPALEHAYLVQDAATAERLTREYPRDHFLTPQGEHYHHRLVSGGKASEAGPLALRRDFRELDRRTAELEQALRAAEDSLAEIAERAARLDDELRRLNAAKFEAEKKSIVASEKLRQARESVERAAERLSVLRDEATAAERERQSIQSRHASLESQLREAQAEQSRHEAEISEVLRAGRETRQRLDHLGQEMGEAQARVSALEERTQAVEAERARLTAATGEVRTQLVRLGEQVDVWSREQQQLGQEGMRVAERLARLDVEQEAAVERRQGMEQESAALRARRDAIVPGVESARAALEKSRERRSETEVALARAESDLGHHAQQCREELHVEPDVLRGEAASEPGLEGEALQSAEQEVRELKARLENLGPVNQMALEELQESEERFAFLETQRQDLLGSIEDTSQAIREIDQVSRRQFLEAFEAINGYFAESFRTLFGGGTGQMRLSDEADAESGIDIVAQPPGKRLQNVLLLSGGEKALAALALLIAVFRFTPSPFCILDEVDAPLDDSNVARFTRMIENMSEQTQFILITHNKRTMEISRVMYGVTMQEPGISKLVSVRFDAPQRELVAVPA